jgi:hypothetical protein
VLLQAVGWLNFAARVDGYYELMVSSINSAAGELALWTGPEFSPQESKRSSFELFCAQVGSSFLQLVELQLVVA